MSSVERWERFAVDQAKHINTPQLNPTRPTIQANARPPFEKADRRLSVKAHTKNTQLSHTLRWTPL